MPDTTTRKIGQLALDRGLVSADQLREAVDEFKRRKAAGGRMPLGEVLVEMGCLTRPQLDQLLGAQGGKKSPRQVIPGFELVRKLGEGGMGATYLARQESMDRLVALKVLRKSLSRDEQFVARFRREAQLAGKLDHVNIVQAIDVGEAGGLHYLIMEYVEGRSLNDLMPESGPMAEDHALHFVIQIARALAFADKHQIIHRDVKPDNVMVTAENIAKLCDFGLARQSGAETKLTQTGTAMGSPHYVSPEQARGDREVDIRSDIYSLGATLYHLVTGETPFSGSSAVVVMTKHLTEQLPWPQDINRDVSEACALVISRMMAKDQADRYQKPAELIADLELAIDGKIPGEGSLAPGLSSVATRGTVPIVVQPPDSRPRRYRETRLSAAAPTDPTMPVIAASTRSPAPQGSSIKWLLAAVAGGALLVVALLIWSATGDGDDKPGPDGPAGNGKNGPENGGGELGAMYDYALKWWKEHPAEFEEARRKFEGLRDKAGGVLAMKIEDTIREIDKAEEEQAGSALGPLGKKARQLAGIGDFDAAIAALRNAPADVRSRAAREIGELEKELEDEARRKLQPIMFDAERLSNQGQPEAALERLKDLRGARYKLITGDLAALKTRLQKEKTDTAGLAVKRDRATAAKKLTALLDEVNRPLMRGDREEAERALTRGKKLLGATEKREFAARLAAMENILRQMRLFDEAHHKAITALIGRKVSIRTRKGTGYSGMVTRFNEEEGFIELRRSGKTYKVRLENLADGEFDKLVKPMEPKTPQAWMAMAVMAMGGGDARFASEALGNAGNNPLRDYYSARLKQVKKTTGNDRARWEWENEILPLLRRKNSPETARRIVDQVEAWLRENQGTPFHAGKRSQARKMLREARKHLGDEHRGPEPEAGPEGEIPDELRKYFKGRVARFDSRSLEVKLSYDFSDKKQLADFSATGGRWEVKDGKLVGTHSGSGEQALRMKAYFEDQLELRVDLVVKQGKQGYLRLGASGDKALLGLDFLGPRRRKEPRVIFGRDRGSFSPLNSKLRKEMRPGRSYSLMLRFADRRVTASFGGAQFAKCSMREDKQLRVALGINHKFAPRPTTLQFDNLVVEGRFDRPWYQQNVEAKAHRERGGEREGPQPGPGDSKPGR